MINYKQILELKNKCKSSSEYHRIVYSSLINTILNSENATSTRVFLNSTYIPENNIQIQGLMNELLDDGFKSTLTYVKGCQNTTYTYLLISWK